MVPGAYIPVQCGLLVLTRQGRLWERRYSGHPYAQEYSRDDGWRAHLSGEPSQFWVCCRPDNSVAGNIMVSASDPVDVILAKIDEAIAKLP